MVWTGPTTRDGLPSHWRRVRESPVGEPSRFTRVRQHITYRPFKPGRHYRWRWYQRPYGAGWASLPDTKRWRDCPGCADCDIPPLRPGAVTSRIDGDDPPSDDELREARAWLREGLDAVVNPRGKKRIDIAAARALRVEIDWIDSELMNRREGAEANP